MIFRSLARGLRALFRREQTHKELNEELVGFLEMAVEEKMKQGMDRKVAQREVRLERGSVESSKEIIWSGLWESFIETCGQDIRFGLRTLRKNPAFIFVAVLTVIFAISCHNASLRLFKTLICPPT